MKKAIIGLVAALALFGGVAHGQSIDTSNMSNRDLKTLLIQLLEELVMLEQQVLAQTTLQNQTTTPPTAAPEPVILGAAPVQQPTQPLMPEVQKSITIAQDGIRIFATYSENGTPIQNVPLTITADDKGRISHSSVADKWATAQNTELTHDVTVFNRPDFTIGAVFEYIPEASGTRTVTVEGNGVSQTLQIQN